MLHLIPFWSDACSSSASFSIFCWVAKWRVSIWWRKRNSSCWERAWEHSCSGAWGWFKGRTYRKHVIVHYCHVKIMHCPYTCLHPALLTLIIQYLFHSTKPDLPCTMEIPDFDAGYWRMGTVIDEWTTMMQGLFAFCNRTKCHLLFLPWSHKC